MRKLVKPETIQNYNPYPTAVFLIEIQCETGTWYPAHLFGVSLSPELAEKKMREILSTRKKEGTESSMKYRVAPYVRDPLFDDLARRIERKKRDGGKRREELADKRYPKEGKS